MTRLVRTCRYCRQRQVVGLDTDGHGHLVEGPLPCGCDARRRAGICLDCPNPVEGRPGVALRCGPCKKAATGTYSMRWREKHPEAARESERRAQQKRRAKKKAYAAAYWLRRKKDQLWLARRNARKREAGAKNPGRKAASSRRYRDRHPERVKAQQRRSNAKRAAEKRAYQHRYATKYVGEGKQPLCRQCGGEVPWKGRGRPRLDCPGCRVETTTTAEAAA